MFKYRIRKAQTYSFGAVFGEQTESENDCIKQHPLRFPKGCPEPGLSPHDASNGLKAGGDGGERNAMKEKAQLFYLEPQEFFFPQKKRRPSSTLPVVRLLLFYVHIMQSCFFYSEPRRLGLSSDGGG